MRTLMAVIGSVQTATERPSWIANAASIAEAGESNEMPQPSPAWENTYPPCLHHVPEQRIVGLHRLRHGVGVLVPQARRTFDIGEEERDDS
jgi:hypothetical protein